MLAAILPFNGGAASELRAAAGNIEPYNWAMTGRDLQETHHSPLKQISTFNVDQLGLVWSFDLDTYRGQESTPLVIDGKMFTTSAWSKVQAFDAATGRLLWQYDPKVPGKTGVKGCCDVVNRGAVFWNGHVYVGTFDGRLVALDAQSGAVVWSTMTVDAAKPYTITGAPRIAKGNVIIGNGGSDMGGTVRGYVSAYDAETGALAWRFYIVPGKPNSKDNAVSDKIMESKALPTWRGKWWTAEAGGGGGSAWDSMAYDPDLDLLYVGTGNGNLQAGKFRAPDGGDDLFTCSILALRPETGEYVWHYQETPADQWDYDATQHMILTDLKADGKTHKVLMQASKNGFFYVIDRVSGKLISAKPFSKLNWASGIDMATGRPIVHPAADYSKTGKPWLAIPGSMGAHDWQPMAYNPDTGLVYIPAHEMAAVYSILPGYKSLPDAPNTGLDFGAPPPNVAATMARKYPMKSYLLAWDPMSQKEVWRVEDAQPWQGGVLSTAGGLVFQGTDDMKLHAYDAKNGKRLWTFDARSAVMAAPISFAVGEKQYVSVVVGRGGPFALAFPRTVPQPVNQGRVLTFALGGKSQLPAVVMRPGATQPAPEQFATPEQIKRGRQGYERVCVVCHGFAAVSGGVTPDLRHSSAIRDKSAWNSILIDGVLASRGMVSFKEDFLPEQIEAIRAYIIDRARAEIALETATTQVH